MESNVNIFKREACHILYVYDIFGKRKLRRSRRMWQNRLGDDERRLVASELSRLARIRVIQIYIHTIPWLSLSLWLFKSPLFPPSVCCCWAVVTAHEQKSKFCRSLEFLSSSGISEIYIGIIKQRERGGQQCEMRERVCLTSRWNIFLSKFENWLGSWDLHLLWISIKFIISLLLLLQRIFHIVGRSPGWCGGRTDIIGINSSFTSLLSDEAACFLSSQINDIWWMAEWALLKLKFVCSAASKWKSSCKSSTVSPLLTSRSSVGSFRWVRPAESIRVAELRPIPPGDSAVRLCECFDGGVVKLSGRMEWKNTRKWKSLHSRLYRAKEKVEKFIFPCRVFLVLSPNTQKNRMEATRLLLLKGRKKVHSALALLYDEKSENTSLAWFCLN